MRNNTNNTNYKQNNKNEIFFLYIIHYIFNTTNKMSSTNTFKFYNPNAFYYMHPEEMIASDPLLDKNNIRQALIFCDLCKQKHKLTPENNKTLSPNYQYRHNYKTQMYSGGGQCLTPECLKQQRIKDREKADERFWKQMETIKKNAADKACIREIK